MLNPVKPNLFIVGQPKSGTSALFSFLKQHPQINACRVKEPQFFCKDFNSQYFHLSKTPRELENYLALYEQTSCRYHMEASTAYLYSQVAADEICAFNPDARIIIMLREPVDFLYTYHKQLLRNSCKFEEETDFVTALNLEPQRRQGRALPRDVFEEKFLYYSARVKYAEQIERYYARFPRAQIKVIVYDDFKQDNRKVFAEVQQFLGLEEDFVPQFDTVNKQVDVRNRALKQFVDQHTFALKRWIRTTFGKGVFVRLRQMYRNLVFTQGDIQPLAPALREELKPRYRTEVETTGRLLDRDLLREWNY
jgi:hypothetical protein